MKTSYKVAAAKAEAIHEDGRFCRGTISENGEVTLRLSPRSALGIYADIRKLEQLGYLDGNQGPVSYVLSKLLGKENSTPDQVWIDCLVSDRKGGK